MISAGSLRVPPSFGCPKDGLRGVAASSPLHRPVARLMTRCEDARNRSPHSCPHDDSTSSRSRLCPLGFPHGMSTSSSTLARFFSRLPARRVVLTRSRSVSRAEDSIAPVLTQLPARGACALAFRAVARALGFDRARPHAVARSRCVRARLRAVAYAEDVDRACFLTQLPTQGSRRARRARPSPSSGCPREDSDAPDPFAVTCGGFERLETGLAVARG